MHLPADQGDNSGDNNGGGSDSNQATTYTISVTVNDGTDPVQGAKVTFTDKTDSTKTYESGNSGAQGGCTVKPVAGTYVVTATCTGYQNYTHSTDVTVSGDSTLTISLTATGGSG